MLIDPQTNQRNFIQEGMSHFFVHIMAWIESHNFDSRSVICLIINVHNSMMKESRHMAPLSKQQPFPGQKSQSGCARSNLGSLKAILNQGRVPLSQYINEKTAKGDPHTPNLSYFDKLKAMFNRAEMRTGRDRNTCGDGAAMEEEQTGKGVEIDGRMAGFLNDYAEDKKIIAHQKGRPGQPDFRAKDRSMSMNARSRPKYDPAIRAETTVGIKETRSKRTNIEAEALERTYNKAYTQAETLETPGKNCGGLLAIPRFKPAKRETVNYAKFTAIHSAGQLQTGVLDLEETLGCGANATVRLGREKKTERCFAVKVYEKYKLVQPSKKKRVFREIEILSRLDHPGVIRMGDCFEDKRQIHILFELIPQACTLQDYLRGHAHVLPPATRREIGLRVTQAVNYLHENGVAHRDIKTENVMVGEGGAVKLIDFGFATTVAKGETHCGTPNYMAPELFLKKGVYSPFKVDVWALGVLLYYLHEGCYPFRGYNEKELARNVSLGNFAFKRCEQPIREAIASALQVDPTARPSACELEQLLLALPASLQG